MGRENAARRGRAHVGEENMRAEHTIKGYEAKRNTVRKTAMRRTLLSVKRPALWMLIAVMAANSAMPALAKGGPGGFAGGVRISEATDSDAAPPAPPSSPLPATPSELAAGFDIGTMPEIGNAAFTEWFFGSARYPELWEWVRELLADESSENYTAFLRWIEENKDRFLAACEAYAGERMISLFGAATGDLWDQWRGAKMEWDGTGSKENPYKITGLPELMGLSEAVAQGESFSGEYFELQSDVDLGNLTANNGCWNPIGWYKNKTSLGGKPATAFEGIFDGAGNTISGLKFTKTDYGYSYLGLFGRLKDAEVKNLTLDAEEVSGEDNVALLAGSAEGDTVIFGVTVRGEAYGNGDVGGIVGEADGGSGRTVIENCTADNVVINAEGGKSFAGGIAGNVQKADLVDVAAITLDGDSNRIRGKGYVGGIAGRQNEVNIYNSYVDGTIGGNGALAVGGITGLYESGDVIVARMDGEIGKTNNGAASREGTILGTREPRNGFRYGTGKNDNLSYLYADTRAMAKALVGSGISDDNTWTMDAHIGYTEDFDRKYTQVAGTTEKGCGGRYFYEELEDGIQYIITQKLDWDLNAGRGQGKAFMLDHFAPGNQGEPVRGYLVSIPRIDTKNANGTYDNDVASLTAISSTNNTFYRQIDKDSPSAVAPGCTVTVATAAKNKNGNRYQMVYDENEDGHMKPPTYTDEDGVPQPMTYINGGAYSFEMPEADTELNVEYVKVTTELSMAPAETAIAVTQIRSGDRKNPELVTEVRNSEGTLIAKYINGNRDAAVQALPVSIHAEHNGEGSAADRTVLWSIDDTDLLSFDEGWAGGYTVKDARVIPNLNSEFIQGIIRREVKAQADGNYEQAIRNTVYTDSAVVTAATNPSTSVDHQAVTGTCRVNVTFQILDHTTVRVENMTLNQNHISFDIVRRLTGDRRNPAEEYIVTEPISLDASLHPSQPFFKNVAWADREAGKLISLTPSGVNDQSCEIAVKVTADGKNNSAWLQNIINADNTAKAADGGYLKLEGAGAVTETVTATSEDQTHGVVSAQCQVTVNFMTDDRTVIHPEGIRLDKTELSYDLVYSFAGDTKSTVKKKTGFGDRDTLTAAVLPELEGGHGHEPYDRAVKWISSDEDALTVRDGKLTVCEDAKWVKDALSRAPYTAVKRVTVTAVTEDGGKAGDCQVELSFRAEAVEADREAEEFHLVLTKSGRRSSPIFTWSGGEEKAFDAVLYGGNESLTKVWSVDDKSVITVTPDGRAAPVIGDAGGGAAPEWIRRAMEKFPYKGETTATVYAAASDGSMTDRIPVKLTFEMVDRTYSGGSSSGGSGGGGSSGGSSSGVTPGGTTSSYVAGGPAGSVTGTWVQSGDGRWLFTGQGRTYADEWAYIHNPYAAAGQSALDWFRFDAAGYMVTGWYTDTAGNTFYLWPVSDGSLGHMLTGWHWIAGNDGQLRCYYFSEKSDGARGRLLRDEETPDGNLVNADGAWTVDGMVQIKMQE